MTKINYILDSKHKPSSYSSQRYYNRKKITGFKIKKISSYYSYNYSDMGTLEGYLEFFDKQPTKIPKYKYNIFINFGTTKAEFPTGEYCLKHAKRIVQKSGIGDKILECQKLFNKFLDD